MDKKFFVAVDVETGYFTAGDIKAGNPKVEGAISCTYDDLANTIMYWLAQRQPELPEPDLSGSTPLDSTLFEGMGDTTATKMASNGIDTVEKLAQSNFTAVRAAGVHHVNTGIVDEWVRVARQVLS